MGDTLASEAKTKASAFTEFNVRQESGRPNFIRLCDEVVERLQREADIKKNEAFGILLGTVEIGTECTITVENFEPAGVVEQHIRSWAPQPGSAQEVVGYYRSHSRSDFTLDEADRALFERCFPKEARIALLVKAPLFGHSVGTFYLGEEGSLDDSRVTVEFPFDLKQLTSEGPSEEKPVAPAQIAKAISRVPLTKAAMTGAVVVASVVGLSAMAALNSASTPTEIAIPKPATIAPPPEALELTRSKPSLAKKLTAPPVPEKSAATPPKAPPVPSAPVAKVDGSLPYTPPYAMRQFAPIVPEAVRESLRGDVVVQVRAIVDSSGSVVSAQPVTQSLAVAEPLRLAATNAVKRWKFEPARRGDEKVASETVLSFTFRK